MNQRQRKGYSRDICLRWFCKCCCRRMDSDRFCPADEPEDRVRETREGFVEVRGRGCWHQIHCYFDYKYMIPFTYPIRMIGEAKFYTKRLSKRHIRSLIGVLKDIQEYYYAEEGKNVDEYDHYYAKEPAAHRLSP